MDYAFTKRNQLRSGRVSLIDTLNQKTESHLIDVAIAIGFSNKLSLAISMPVIINRSVNKLLDQTDTKFGDLSVTGRTFFSQRLFSMPVNIQFAIGASIPVGGGIANVITDDRNFASGTIDPIGSFIIALGITPDWNITTKFFTRQIIATSSDNQEVGDQYAFGLEAIYAPLARSYTANVGISVISRGRDIIAGSPFLNSGGDWVYTKIGFSKTLIGTGESAIRFWSEAQLPVYLHVKGIQLTEKWNIRFGFTTGFSLFGYSEKEKGFEHFHLPTNNHDRTEDK